MTRQEIIQSLLNEAQHELAKNGYQFAGDAERQFSEMVRSGVNNNMSVTDCANGNRIVEAQRNTREFIKRLCEKHRREQRGIIVENRTFSQARLSLCPMWPLC
jgi:hypothetical protein